MPWVYEDVREGIKWRAIDCTLLNDATLKEHRVHYAIRELNDELYECGTLWTGDDIRACEAAALKEAKKSVANLVAKDIRRDPKFCIQ